MHTFTDANFDNEVLKSNTMVLVDFWAGWCGPCKVLSPIIKELAKEYENKAIKIGEMNVDENPNTPSRYSIMSIPTLLFLKNGKVVDQLVGVQSKQDLNKKIDQLLG